MPLRAELTPADQAGAWPELAIIATERCLLARPAWARPLTAHRLAARGGPGLSQPPLPANGRRARLACMPTRAVHLVIDAADPSGLAAFWAAALGWDVVGRRTGRGGRVEPAGFELPGP